MSECNTQQTTCPRRAATSASNDPTQQEKPACSSPDELSITPRWLIREERGWRRLIQNFIPGWFAVTMGTGIVSILLRNLPYHTQFLHPISTAIFILNVVLFLAILLASILRYFLYPGMWTLMIRHPVQSLFLGTAPMGFATIINMFVAVCVPMWGDSAAKAAWAMWWIDVVASVACCFGLPFMMMSAHNHTLHTMTAAWLLPIVAPIVASASGAIVGFALPNPQHALWTLVTSYVLWGMGLPLAMMVLVIYFQRLAVHKLPPREVIVSVFLPLGPLGQGGFAVMQLGKLAMDVFPKTSTLSSTPAAGAIVNTLGTFTALILWGFGLTWLLLALAALTRGRIPFNMGWWGFTFPLGVYAMSTLTLGAELDSGFFRVLGTVFAGAVVLLYVLVAVRTAMKAWSGELFVAPCIKELKGTCDRQQRERAENGAPRV